MIRRLRVENLVLIRDAELPFAPGLNVVTGETGAGKTILAQAFGLLLGAKSDDALVGPGGSEAYVEAELDLPDDLLADDELAAVAELRPEDEPGLVAARRVFADGRSRAYAWGRAVAREELAATMDRLLAMSGQFEQRRLGRPAHQLELLDAFCGEDQLRRRAEAAAVWRELQIARRRLADAERVAGDREGRLVELRALLEATAALTPEAEESLRAERERLRNLAGIAEACETAAESLAPELSDGEGAADLAARAERSLRPVASLAPELEDAAAAAEAAGGQLREAASTLRSFLASLEAQPGRLEEVEETLGRIADAKRRFGAITVTDLLDQAAAAQAELDGLGRGEDPAAQAAAAVAELDSRYQALAAELHAARSQEAPGFARAARVELAELGLGDGELVVELHEREPGPTGRDEATFFIRPNPGMPLAPVAATASGGELSRIALALRIASHGRLGGPGQPTIVFDEIDAGVGGTTAHAVAEALQRLAESAQVITITHLPQIASLAEQHFRVEKIPGDPTHTRIAALSAAERRSELERMLGGREFATLVVSGDPVPPRG